MQETLPKYLNEYELVQTAKAGRWYPYYRLKNPIVEFIPLVCSPDLSPNIEEIFVRDPAGASKSMKADQI